MCNQRFLVGKYSMLLPAAALACALASMPVSAATLFTDGFESGSLGSSQNGVSWGSSTATVVSTEQAFSGNRSLRFRFSGGGSGQDAFAEQRVRLPQRNEYWFRYRLYIPSNYTHRSDGDSNNKFLAVYRAPYETPGFQVNFSMHPTSGGGSNLAAHYYDDGRERASRSISSSFITSADNGKWMEIVVQVKVPTSASSDDGIMRIWKNGSLAGSITDLSSWGGTGENYITEAYLLGWSNSGFSQETLLFIDDIVIADAPFDTKTPSAPADLTAR